MRFEHLYIHIPFCVSKCNYCDFISYPAAQQQAALDDFGRLLLCEAALWRAETQLGPWRSVYIGGGTPSLLPADSMRALLGDLLAAQGCEDKFPNNGAATGRPLQKNLSNVGVAQWATSDESMEITLEANPESVSAEKLAAWRQAGINRLSLGAQSFDNNLLQAMGRPHTAAQIQKAVRLARAAGFTNISVDLIYGLPGQTLAGWRQDIARAILLSVEHISLYGLSLSLDSPWGCALAEGKLSLPGQDESADMLEAAIEILPKNGYEHYEISNFARAGYESRHNCAYWQRDNYLGLGAAAASCYAEQRWFNQRDLAAYAAALSAGRLPVTEKEYLSIEEVLGEAMFLGLRLRRGINLEQFAARYGVAPQKYYQRPLAKLQNAGLVELVNGYLRLTEKGVLLGNEVFMQFM